MFSKILVPLDGSELGELALPYAEKLAGAFNSSVTLTLVCDKPDCRYQNEHLAYLEKMVGVVKERTGVQEKVKPVLLKGHPAEEIIDYATKNNISLVVMATHGRSGIMSWVVGSVTNDVLHNINVPVLLVRADASLLKPRRRGQVHERVLVPLDSSEASEAVLPYVKELVDKLKISVDLLQVVEPGQHVHTVGGLTYVPFLEEEIEHLKASAREYLSRISDQFAGKGVTVKTEIRTGEPAAEIIKLADKTKSWLIAMSPHVHTGILKSSSGSMVQKILHGGKTSILLVRVPDVKS